MYVTPFTFVEKLTIERKLTTLFVVVVFDDDEWWWWRRRRWWRRYAFIASNKNKQIFDVGKLVVLFIECLSENISRILGSKI